jgi:putative PIN family toxin of toxin-antitoxin system
VRKKQLEMQKIYQIVIDTNVLVSGLRSSQGASYKLLSMLNDDRWQINLSTALVYEYEEILKGASEDLGLDLQDVDLAIAAICNIANHHPIFFLWRPMASDPDDDLLIDLAFKAQVDFIITYNLRDLRSVERFGIQVITPKQFLQVVGEIES